jgi:hypothetical protein
MTGEEPGDVTPQASAETKVFESKVFESTSFESTSFESTSFESTPSESTVAESKAARSRIVERLYTSSYHRVFCFVRRYTNDEEAEANNKGRRGTGRGQRR